MEAPYVGDVVRHPRQDGANDAADAAHARVVDRVHALHVRRDRGVKRGRAVPGQEAESRLPNAPLTSEGIVVRK